MDKFTAQDTDVWVRLVEGDYFMELFFTEADALDNKRRKDRIYKAKLVDWQEIS